MIDNLLKESKNEYNYRVIKNLIKKHLEISDVDKRLKFDYRFEEDLIKLLELIEEDFVKEQLERLNEKDS